MSSFLWEKRASMMVGTDSKNLLLLKGSLEYERILHAYR